MFSYKMDRRATLEKEEQKKDAIEECTGQGSRSQLNHVRVFCYIQTGGCEHQRKVGGSG
jgi:hypothetical protein